VTPLLVFEVELATRHPKTRRVRVLKRARTAAVEERLARLDLACDAVHVDGRTRRR
jgi:hypothetical protein